MKQRLEVTVSPLSAMDLGGGGGGGEILIPTWHANGLGSHGCLLVTANQFIHAILPYSKWIYI